MTLRTRQIVDSTSGGAYKDGLEPWVYLSDFVYRSATCTDHTGPGDCAPFDAEHVLRSGGVVNRPFTGNGRVDQFDNMTCHFVKHNSLSHLVIGDSPSNAAVATSAAARTNPSRPYVDVPTMIGELKDVPFLLRDLGRNVFERAGRTNLNYQFGIKPYVDDLFKLSVFGDQVRNRVKEIERLKSSNGLRRTISHGNYSNQFVSNVTVQSLTVSINVPVTVTTTQSVRAHVRWMPEADMSGMSPEAERLLALRAVLGGTVDLSTVWNLLPWSWLADWCGNVGTFLQATRNLIPAVPHVHIMRTTKTGVTSPSYKGTNGLTMTGIACSRVSKQRTPGLVSVDAHVPFLDGNQMGILASLAVTRR